MQLTGSLLNKPFLGIISAAASLVGTIDGQKWSAASKHIEEYSMRQLSYESDALSAFLGILHSLEESREPIRHLWGLLLWKIPFYAVRVTLN